MKKEKYPVGRPKKYTPKEIEKIRKLFEEYIGTAALPSVTDFLVKQHLRKDVLYRDYRESFDDLIELCRMKKENILEMGALTGELNPTMAIFSLKQLDWTDKKTVDANVAGVSGKPIEHKIIVEVVDVAGNTDKAQ